MYPYLFSYASIFIPSWHVLFVLAALSAYGFMLFLRRRLAAQLVSREQLSWLYAFAYSAGYVGARLLSVVIEQQELKGIGARLAALLQLGPLTLYGGVLAGSAAALLYARWQRLSWAVLADITLPAVVLGIAIGRIGCFLNGDDYGTVVAVAAGESAPWWAVRFPVHAQPLYRLPVQLWESAACFGLVASFCALLPWLKRHVPTGVGGAGIILSYSLVRYVIEFWRDDLRGWVLHPQLSTSQFVSIMVAVVSLASLTGLLLQHRREQ